MTQDARGRLESDPFVWRITRDGAVRVSRGGREVAVIGGREAAKLIAKLARASAEEAQHLLARATGHYRHGTEH